MEEPKDKPKAKKATKSKYEELPEIPDYERPDLEKYDKSDFDPTKKVKFNPDYVDILSKGSSAIQQPQRHEIREQKLKCQIFFDFCQNRFPRYYN